jgi:hypothetical protein
MAITRTAKGTAQGNASSLTISSVTLAQGASLIVGFGVRGATGVTVTWNGQNLTVDALEVNNAGQGVASLHGVNAGTGNIVLTWTGTGSTKAALWASQFEGLAATGAYDVKSIANGTGTNPKSGPVTTASVEELWVGNCNTWGPSGDAAGSWAQSFSDGQRVGTTGGSAGGNSTVSEGYRTVASGGVAEAEKTGITSRTWTVSVVAYKAAVVGDNSKGSMFFGA